MHNPQSFAASAMKNRLLVAMLMLAVGSCSAVAESLKPESLTVQDQIAALKKQSQEMREQIDVLKQQSRRLSPSRRMSGSAAPAAPQVLLITNGEDDKASVRSLKRAIESMNGSS
ncbi:MAG: hypothetical protein PHG47_00680 [Sulfuricella sp.]|nr:hypothetical protein [Sulfuricella sp.]